MQAHTPFEFVATDLLVKGQNLQPDDLLPMRHPSRDTLYLQYLLSPSEASTSTGSPTVTTESSSSTLSLLSLPSIFDPMPSSQFPPLPTDISPDPASVRRTQTYHHFPPRPPTDEAPTHNLLTHRFNPFNSTRNCKRPPAANQKSAKCPHCDVTLKWANGLRKHVQVSRNISPLVSDRGSFCKIEKDRAQLETSFQLLFIANL